ncbi:ATP-NAD kinase-like domain-containing protein [Zopfochytrium polystomum]|nr:ATP-NAD kinase-like domain-containing protein [Zopfochytrium polystomum]
MASPSEPPAAPAADPAAAVAVEPAAATASTTTTTTAPAASSVSFTVSLISDSRSGSGGTTSTSSSASLYSVKLRRKNSTPSIAPSTASAPAASAAAKTLDRSASVPARKTAAADASSPPAATPASAAASTAPAAAPPAPAKAVTLVLARGPKADAEPGNPHHITLTWSPPGATAAATAIPLSYVIAVTAEADPSATSLKSYRTGAVTSGAASHRAHPERFSIHWMDATGSNTSAAAATATDAGPNDKVVPKYRVATFEADTPAAKTAVLAALKAHGLRVTELDDPDVPARKPVLLIVNPFGGVKEADTITKETIVPILNIAQLTYKRVDTDYKGHAEELVHTVHLKDFSAAVAVSGDGVCHELLNSLMRRPDWADVVRDLAVGNIGAGSSNAMNKNLGLMHPAYGTLAIVHMHTRLMDLLSVTLHKTGEVLYSHLNATWGYIADLDIETDAFRWMGRDKVLVSAIRRLIALRRYRAWLVVVPHEEGQAAATPAAAASPPSVTTEAAAVAAEGETAAAATADAAKPANAQPSSSDPTHITASPFYATAPPTIEHVGPARTYASLSTSEILARHPTSLVVTPGSQPISYFNASNLAYLSTTYRASQTAKLSAGFIDVSLDVPTGVERAVMVKGLLADTVISGAGGVQVIRARALRLLPVGRGKDRRVWDGGAMSDEEKRKEMERLRAAGLGVLAVSGEPITMQEITVEIHPAVVNVLAAPWLVE